MNASVASHTLPFTAEWQYRSAHTQWLLVQVWHPAVGSGPPAPRPPRRHSSARGPVRCGDGPSPPRPVVERDLFCSTLRTLVASTDARRFRAPQASAGGPQTGPPGSATRCRARRARGFALTARCGGRCSVNPFITNGCIVPRDELSVTTTDGRGLRPRARVTATVGNAPPVLVLSNAHGCSGRCADLGAIAVVWAAPAPLASDMTPHAGGREPGRPSACEFYET